MASATLTWASSGAIAKTGTTNAALITDLVAAINALSPGAAFSWQVASSSTVGPLYIVLKPKSGAAGRILLVIWASVPAGNNAAILDAAPSTNTLFGAYFPAGNVDTPSNLTAASGTILGDDTGAVKVWAGAAIASFYGAGVQMHYFDSAEALVLGAANPGGGNHFFCAAGNIAVDASDNAYAAVMSTAGSTATFGAVTSPLAHTVTVPTAGSTSPCVRTNYGSANRAYFCAWGPSGNWASVTVSATDILTQTSTNSAWFVPVQLLGQTKGEGFVLKLRQMALGPGTLGPLTAYNTTGPVVAARQACLYTAGGNGLLWMTNFKV
jgi:hypothetical protein